MPAAVTEKIISYCQNKKHIIWDWNGTLLDDVSLTVDINNKLLSEHGLKTIDHKIYCESFDFPVIAFYRELGFDFQKESFASLSGRFVDLFMQKVSELRLQPYALDTIRTLQSLGYEQSILSAADQQSLDVMTEHFGVRTYLSQVYGIASRQADSKIARGQELIRRSGLQADQALLVGDTLHDLEVGRELGIDVVLVTGGHQAASRLKAAHQKVIEN